MSIAFFFDIDQAVCVTRFDQSECVICRVIFALGKSLDVDVVAVVSKVSYIECLHNHTL